MSSNKTARMDLLETELRKLREKGSLSQAVAESEKLIDLLTRARDEISSSTDAPSANLILTKLQNPVNTAFESITDALRPVDRGQKGYAKVLNHELPLQHLPTDYDAMAHHKSLINRAIAMHMLREGQFDVAHTFLVETRPDTNLEDIADERDIELLEKEARTHYNHGEYDERTERLQSLTLQVKFSSMYSILSCIRDKNLLPAIEWTAQHSSELDARGSNLEFELNKLQFIYLFQEGGLDPEVTAMMTDEERREHGVSIALNWARERFVMFSPRHTKQIQQLATSVIFASNLGNSPYRAMFEDGAMKLAFEEAANSFTREFCSLLGLSSESPLYIATTAGAVALPQLRKYTRAMREKRTEWTTEAELAFETPLPRSMIYHPIFVCPVSKEQTTDENPPVMLPCGHVVARESLHRLPGKSSKTKCPYCPAESYKSEATIITIL